MKTSGRLIVFAALPGVPIQVEIPIVDGLLRRALESGNERPAPPF